jgi:hypothetical protein
MPVLTLSRYGTLHLGFTYPEIFSALSSIAPACLPHVTDEMPAVVADTYGTNPDFYDVTHPYHLVGANISQINSSGTKIRVFTGSLDIRLTAAIDRLMKRFDQVGLQYQHRESEGAAHVYPHILAGAGSWVTEWWTEVAKSIVRPEFES